MLEILGPGAAELREGGVGELGEGEVLAVGSEGEAGGVAFADEMASRLQAAGDFVGEAVDLRVVVRAALAGR